MRSLGADQIAFDLKGTLDGLATGPLEVTGRAVGGVLVRNPFFDVSFAVPTVVRRSEPFTLYATVTNKGEGIANDVRMTLDAVGTQSQTRARRRERGTGRQSVPTVETASLEYCGPAARG